MFEQTVMVMSYAAPALLDESSLLALRKFLHRFGRDANQGEVGVVIGGEYFGISEYDAAS